MGLRAPIWLRWILLSGTLLTMMIALGTSAPMSMPTKVLVSKERAVVTPSPTPDIEQQLQIEQLRQETSWAGRLQGYLPAGSALAALAAAGWGIFVYLRDQRRNLQLRTQVEIASNLSRLIDRDQGEAVKSAQVVSALAALTALADQSADKDKLLSDVTNIIVTAVMNDINFGDVNQVNFEGLCLKNWNAYETHLADKPEDRVFVAYRYIRALYDLRAKHSDYISRVEWDSKNMKYFHPDNVILKPEEDFLLFTRLAQGVRTHWQRLDAVRRVGLASEFEAVTGNTRLTAQLLGGSS
jgi:hypothetical protein